MKYLEKINIINSKDLDTWSVTDLSDKNNYIGSKKLNIELGLKVKNLLEEYGLHVDVGSGDWLKKQGIILKTEKDFKEYRVHLSTIIPWEDYLESDGMDEDEFEKLSDVEQQKFLDRYESSKIDHDSNMEFSVFLPLNVDRHNIEYAALSDASDYLLMLNNCIPNIFNGTEEDTLQNETSGFKCFLNSKGLKITNDNIEDVVNINYRIYKDSKFFMELKENLENYKSLIKDWLNLLK